MSDLIRDCFPIIERMQAWMHNVSRYDGWSENDHLKETAEVIHARRKLIRKFAESLFEVMPSWDGGIITSKSILPFTKNQVSCGA